MLHLASDASSFITGTALLVDGGVSIESQRSSTGMQRYLPIEFSCSADCLGLRRRHEATGSARRVSSRLNRGGACRRSVRRHRFPFDLRSSVASISPSKERLRLGIDATESARALLDVFAPSESSRSFRRSKAGQATAVCRRLSRRRGCFRLVRQQRFCSGARCGWRPMRRWRTSLPRVKVARNPQRLRTRGRIDAHHRFDGQMLSMMLNDEECCFIGWGPDIDLQ